MKAHTVATFLTFSKKLRSSCQPRISVINAFYNYVFASLPRNPSTRLQSGNAKAKLYKYSQITNCQEIYSQLNILLFKMIILVKYTFKAYCQDVGNTPFFQSGEGYLHEVFPVLRVDLAEEGECEGMEKGIKKGRKEGLKEGLKEGKKEGKLK